MVVYVPFFNVLFDTRPIPLVHFACPAFSFFVAIFFYDELRKMWIRDGIVREAGVLRLRGWFARNTYY